MSTNIKQFLTGIGLVPQSSDPVSPVEGQLQFADGTVRASGLWQYKSLQWQAIGGGGGGLDVFFSEEFESNTASSFTSGNNATFDNGGSLVATLGNETVTPLSNDRSISLTQASGSLNDFIKSGSILLDPKQKGNTVGVSLYYTYDGDDGDIVFVAYDNTNSTVLTDSLDTLDATSGATRFSTSFFIPATCSSLSYGFQVKSETIGAILVFDDIEISTNPFVSKQLSRENEFSARITAAGAITSQNSEWISSITKGSTGIYTVNLVNGLFTVIPSVEGIVETNSDSTFTAVPSTTSIVIEINSGGIKTDRDFSISVSRQGADYGQTTEHIVTPAKRDITQIDSSQYTTSTADLTTFTVNNLIVGKKYVVFAKLQTYSDSGIQNYIYFRSATGGGGSAYYTAYDNDNNGGQGNSIDPSFVFTAVSTTLVPRYETSNGAANSSCTMTSVSVIPFEAEFLAAVPVQKVAFLKEIQVSGTQGGTFTAGSFVTRTLNTVEGDSEIVSLSANQFTLQAGKYIIEARAPAFAVSSHVAKLRNITDSTDDAIGTSGYAENVDGGSADSFVNASIEITSAKVFEIQNRSGGTQATNGFGAANSYGVSEVYTQVKITKLK